MPPPPVSGAAVGNADVWVGVGVVGNSVVTCAVGVRLATAELDADAE